MSEEPGREARRARRIRDRERMLARALEVTGRFHPEPHGGDPAKSRPWRDLEGRVRRGQATWDDLHAFRRLQARLLAEHLKSCSCHMCGNPRRFWGARTVQELRAEAAADDALRTEGLPAASVRPARRHGWR